MPMPKPKTEGHYMKAPKAGQSVTFRILGDPIEYFLAFKTNAEGKISPVRRAEFSEFKPGDYDTTSKYGKVAPVYAMAFPVLSDAGDVKVFEVRQKTILDALYGLENNNKWGDLSGYDVTLTGDEDGKGYTVTPDPKAPLSKKDREKWDALVRNGFDLRVLLNNDDPFTTAGDGGPVFTDADAAPAGTDDDIPF